MRPLLTGVFIALLALVATPAGAQTTGKNELAIFAGISLVNAETTDSKDVGILASRYPDLRILIYPPLFEMSRSLDGSGELGVRYGREVTETIALQGDFSIAPAHQLKERISYGCPDFILCIAGAESALFVPNFVLSERVVAYHYGAGIRLRVVPSPLRPSVSAGIGGITYTGEGYRKSEFAFRVGGSVAASVKNLTTEIEVIDAIVADHFVTTRVEHDVHVRVALGVRW